MVLAGQMFGFLSRGFIISRLNIAPPEAATGRHGLAIAATIRDEGAYLGEWLDFHRAVGVRSFILYDDASSDDTRLIVEQRARSHDITFIPWAQRVRYDKKKILINNQVLAYAHAICNFGAQFRWMSFIDVDEFLVPMAENTLLSALARLEPFRNISLPWHMFGTSGQQQPPGDGVLRHYVQRRAQPMAATVKGVVNFKSMVDPCFVTRVKVHGMETGDSRTHNDIGAAATMNSRFSEGFHSNAAIQLNHYYTRSQAEFSAKINGRRVGSGGGMTAKGKAVMAERGRAIEDGAIPDSRAKELAERLIAR